MKTIMERTAAERENAIRYELCSIDLLPVLRIGSVLFLLIGLMIGVLAFLIFPHPSSAGLSLSTRFLSAILFAALYAVIFTFAVVLLVWLYNLLAARTNWFIAVTLSRNLIEKR